MEKEISPAFRDVPSGLLARGTLDRVFGKPRDLGIEANENKGPSIEDISGNTHDAATKFN